MSDLRAVGNTPDITEIWRPVLGQEGRYEVSSHGRVKTLARMGIRKDGSKSPVTERIRKLIIDETGYALVSFPTPNGPRQRFVHRVVLEAFVGPRPEGMECRHLDGNPLNNRLENLCWGTPSENAWDRVHHGNHFQAKKTHCNRGHEFTPENTRIKKNVYGRECRACERLREQRRRKTKAA